MSTNISVLPGQLLPVVQAAKRLGISRRTLERLIEFGRFPRPLKIGNKTLVPEAELVTFTERLKREGGVSAARPESVPPSP